MRIARVSPDIDPAHLDRVRCAVYFSCMETVVQELQRKIKIIQRAADRSKGGQKELFERCLQNARQTMANYLEVERILQQSRR